MNPLSTFEEWTGLALQQDWARQWVPGAIYPREMVFFLTRCDAANISRVIESGRQDGFSTMVLGEYSERRNVDVVSIDLETDPERTANCRRRLAGYSRLHLVKGNTYREAGFQVTREPNRRTAFLMDGPKRYQALSLLFSATAFPGVRVLAVHNLARGEPVTVLFESVADGPAFYEQCFDRVPEAWGKLTEAEKSVCAEYEGGRSLDKSTLGVLEVTEDARRQMRSIRNPGFASAQPGRIALLWRFGLFGIAANLYRRSER